MVVLEVEPNLLEVDFVDAEEVVDEKSFEREFAELRGCCVGGDLRVSIG